MFHVHNYESVREEAEQKCRHGTINIHLKLSTLKPIHAKVLMDIYDSCEAEGESLKAAGINEALEHLRIQGNFFSLDNHSSNNNNTFICTLIYLNFYNNTLKILKYKEQ